MSDPAEARSLPDRWVCALGHELISRDWLGDDCPHRDREDGSWCGAPMNRKACPTLVLPTCQRCGGAEPTWWECRDEHCVSHSELKPEEWVRRSSGSIDDVRVAGESE